MAVVAPLILLAVMYLFLVRPQQVRARRQRELISSVAVGDEVLTVGGLVGRIVSLSDEAAEIEIADGIVVTFVRGAISRKMPEPAAEMTDVGAGADDVSDAPAGDSPELEA